MCQEAKKLRSMIDDEHAGFYLGELDLELNAILENAKFKSLCTHEK